MTAISSDKKNTKNDTRLIYFDYFRAFAILIIILGHCYNAWPRNEIWEATLVNMISGGTALFVFISGFFFHHVYFPKYQYKSFVKNKTLYVFLPYLILSLLYMIYYYCYQGEIVMAGVLNEFFGPHLNNQSLVLLNLMTGRTLWAYWYIPFAMLLFLLSPVFIQFIQLTVKTQIAITISLFILSIFIHRPSWEINPIHSMIYYVPYYLLGIVYSMNRIRINQKIEGKLLLLLLITILVAILMHLLGQTDSKGKASMFLWNGIDFMIFQKISLIAFMLSFTMYLQQYDFKWLKVIANMSFAFFFLHQWALSLMRRYSILAFEHGFGGVLMIFSLALLASFLIALVVKGLLKSKSRYVIGW